MDIRLLHCMLPVDDPDKALWFYRDLLGFEVRKDVSFEGMRWLTVTPPAQPDLEIVLEPPDANPNASTADKQLLNELLAKGILARAVFSSDDVDATFEHLRDAGAEVVQEPMDMPYGVRDCAFRDPAGNLVRFNART